MHTKVAYNVWQHSTLHCTRGSLSDNKIQNIVDKYTVEYITVLTQAQSSLNHEEFKNNEISDKSKQVWHKHWKI